MTTLESTHSVGLIELADEVDRCLRADLPVMVWGPGGVGKSDSLAQAAKRYGGGFIDFRTNLMDPVDLMGVPNIELGRTMWNPPGTLPDARIHGATGVLLLDELPNSHRATQSALYQLVLNRRLGSYVMPESWRIVAAGNRMNDHAGTYEMPLPLKSRFMHYEVKADISDWAAWAERSGIHPAIIGLLRWKPELLHDVTPDATASPTPRTWAMVSRGMTALNGDTTRSFVAAAVGLGAAMEMDSYLEVYQSLPSPMSMLKKPSRLKKYLNEPGILYALNSTVARAMNVGLIDKLARYMEELPPEFKVLLVKTLDQACPDEEVMRSSFMVDWLADNTELLV